MAAGKSIRAAESKSQDFQDLMFRFLGANERLKLAAHALGREEDCSAATFVVEEVTEALVLLRSDFEDWRDDHECAHKAKEVQS
jgi:hypothetical protein